MRSCYPHPKTNTFINLSKHKLTPEETEILKLGPSFVSQPPSLNTPKTKRHLSKLIFNIPTLNQTLSDIVNVRLDFKLNSSEKEALNKLKCNPNIVITEADKGDTWVILNKLDYVFECNRQLSDSNIYRPLDHSFSTNNVKLFNNCLRKMLADKEISKTQFLKLSTKTEDIHTRIFYILPKIHKPLNNWTVKEVIPTGRPIIGNTCTEDTAICKYIDSFLQPIVSKQKHILSNSDHLMHLISNYQCSTSTYLFTLDVASLYTNIPISEGLETVKYYFNKYPNVSRPDESILKLLSISLYKNDFYFNGQYYRQIKGVAMGKQYAPNFANLYMCKWEHSILHDLPGPKPKRWYRYIDDIFCIWEDSLINLEHFISLANNFNPNIQLTCKSSFTDIQFLDLIIFKNLQNSFSTMVYLKPTSSLRLIHPRSLHPNHTKTGVIFSQLLRFYKNCTFFDDFQSQTNFLFSALKDQGHSRTSLRHIKQNLYCHVNFKISDNQLLLKGFHPCINKCHICVNHGIYQSSIAYNGGAKIITQYMTCSTSNVIYIILCQLCNLIYVGETSKTVKMRISQHLSAIKLKYSTVVSEHFNLPNHSITDLKFFTLINNSNWSEEKRRLTESKWIKKLNSIKPSGLNTDSKCKSIQYITLPFKGKQSVPSSVSNLLNDNLKTSFNTGTPLRVLFSHKHKIAREGD